MLQATNEGSPIQHLSLIQEDAVPGTVLLVDAQHQLRAKHSEGGKNDIVLVPAPSDHPDDPLNWSPKRKLLSTVSVSVWVFLVWITTAAAYSVLVPISEETGFDLNVLNQGTGYMFLLFGIGCLFWQPVALQYGKRPVYLITLLGTLAMMLWTPHVQSTSQYIGVKILQGFFAAPIESLAEISLADVYFQHERGTYFGLYAFLLLGSNVFAPIIMGFVNDGQGWRWVFYWCAIFVGIAFVFCFFFMEETNWDRSTPQIPSLTKTGDGEYIPDMKSRKDSRDGSQPPMRSQKTYFQKLSIIPQRQPFVLFQIFLRPFIYLTLPGIVWSGITYGTTVVWFNIFFGTASSFLSSPGYNFSASLVGVSFVSALIGVILASFYSGYVADWVMLRLARRNGGVMESEHRLWLFALSVMTTPFGLILWGAGFANHVHWFGLVFAIGVIAFQAVVGISLNISYAIDSYRLIAGEALVSVILIRSVMSFAIGYGLNPWIEGMGPQNALITAGLIGMAWTLTFLPMIKYGKCLRVRSKERYERYVAEEMKLGLGHRPTASTENDASPVGRMFDTIL